MDHHSRLDKALHLAVLILQLTLAICGSLSAIALTALFIRELFK